MYKFLRIFTVIALFLGILSFYACDNGNKDELLNGENDYITYEFSVGEQVNVSHYEIEVSTDLGRTYTDAAGVILASQNEADAYRIKCDVTRFFKIIGTLYTRIKSVDNDGKVLYSSYSRITRKS